MELYKYDTDISSDCWAVRIGRQELYVYAYRDDDGVVKVEVNHGYQADSLDHKLELALFSNNRDAIQAAAERAVSGQEEKIIASCF